MYDGDFGGVFATADRGLTWALNASQDALHGRNILSLAVAPGNPAQLIAGTFEGLLGSTDGGRTWNFMDAFNRTEARNARIYDVSFSRRDANTIYVATDHGLFESRDGAVSWSRNPAVELNTSVYKLSLDPGNPARLLVQTPRGLLLSHDGGIQWVSLSIDGTGVYDFAFSSMPKGRILAASWRGLLYSESDYEDWKPVEGLPVARLDQILCVPGRPQEMYVLSRGSHEMWQSIDGGRDWTKIDNRGLEGTLLRFMSVDGGQPFVVTENHGVFRLDTSSDLVRALRQAP
jgi:photosystem II stability/assembly factor-like uncharacterized protein